MGGSEEQVRSKEVSSGSPELVQHFCFTSAEALCVLNMIWFG